MPTESAFFRRRLEVLQHSLAANQAVLVSKPTDITYYTGFPQLSPTEREAFLLVMANSITLFHHSFSPLPIKASWLKSVPKARLQAVTQVLSEQAVQTLWLDETTLTMAEFHELKQEFTGKTTALPPERVWQQRMVKDELEIKHLRRAGAITARAFKRLLTLIKTGLTERAVANQLTTLMLEEGAQEPAFPVIVAFGPHGALPHHQPTDTKLRPETPVLIDFGARFSGYCADMTRSFWFGKKPSADFQKVEKIVVSAHDSALNSLKQSPFPTAQQLDAAAREFITAAGFGAEFIHTTGHGLGLEIHEPPSVAWNNANPLQPGMALTVEPGVYLADQFGYRHEDTVLLTDKGAQILTRP